MSGFRDFLAREVQEIGWREFVRRADGAFTSGALQGWLRGALPMPSHQIAIAAIVGVPLETIRELVWRAEVAREEGRPPRLFRPAARPQTRGGSGGVAAPQPAGRRPTTRADSTQRTGRTRPITRPGQTSSVKWWSDQRAA